MLLEVTVGLPSYAMNQPTFPEIYEQWLVSPFSGIWAEITLDEVKLAPGDHVLDIACGIGIVARIAMERTRGTGSVVGIDVSPDMLRHMSCRRPSISLKAYINLLLLG
jgi:ubiquinone/menaquinone biosynthesis C-methylase UbiE